MNKGRKIKAIVLLSVCLGFLPIDDFGLKSKAIGPYFSITLLVPTTSSSFYYGALIMAEQLQKIGIDADLVYASWIQIYQRTWDYPGLYPIPDYAHGGFDILFLGWGQELDWNPEPLFSSPSITPAGDNFYQYYNPEMDSAIDSYLEASLSYEEQDYYGKIIQQILYDDLPQITTSYRCVLCVMDQNFTGWDGELWLNDYNSPSMENWSIPNQTSFHYGSPVEPHDFHIYSYEQIYDSYWLNQIYQSLISRNSSLQYHRHYAPNIAINYTSIDGLSYNISLNPNVCFADGIILNATDVKYSIDLFTEVMPDITYGSIWTYPPEITIYDEFTLGVHFNNTFLSTDAIFSYFSIDILPHYIWNSTLPENQFDQATIWANTDPTKLFGAGPYYLYEYNNETGTIHLKRNDYYKNWTGITPYFEDVYFDYFSSKDGVINALANEVIDMIDPSYLLSWNEIPANTKAELVDGGTNQEMAINNMHPYLGTGEFCHIAGPESAKYIRKAISHLYPREIAVEELLQNLGKPGITACPPIATCFDETLKHYNYSIAKALEFMKLAGFDSVIPTPVLVGINLPVFIAIISLMGSSLVYFKYKRIKLN
ncbi:MAG: hypothetical protein FK734_09380 [Asgard group archaeon]|nr:hypothetical protein [Asgard group archaeon]